MSVTHPDEPELPPDWGEAFAAICHTHRGRLIRWLTTIFGPRDAEDIAQEALARLYARPGLLDDEADAWPWLSVVARNVGRDLARHNAFATAVDAHDLADLPAETRVWDQVSARDDADRLVRALARLTSQDRALVRLRDIDGLSIGEIAELTGGNENAIRQQLFRARRKLQNTYVTLGGDRPIGAVALASLRVREFVRRHAPVFDVLTSSAALLAAALPAAAGAAAAGLLLTTGSGARPAAAAAPSIPAADRETPHGATAVRPSDLGLLLARAHRVAAAQPYFETQRHTDQVNVTVTLYKSPTSGEAGDRGYAHIGVADPRGGGELLGVTWHEWQTSPGRGLVCSTVRCPG